MTQNNNPNGDDLKPCYCGASGEDVYEDDNSPAFERDPDADPGVEYRDWVTCKVCGIHISGTINHSATEIWNARPPEQGKAQGEMKIFSDCIPGHRSMKKSEQEQVLGNLKPLWDLVGAYDNYINLLNDETNDLIGLAHVHGWKSKRVEQGKKARARIEKALKAIEAQPRAGEWSVPERLDEIIDQLKMCRKLQQSRPDLARWYWENAVSKMKPLPNPPAQPIKEERRVK